jgi:phosphate starvation-inducible membrane PsiE
MGNFNYLLVAYCKVNEIYQMAPTSKHTEKKNRKTYLYIFFNTYYPFYAMLIQYFQHHVRFSLYYIYIVGSMFEGHKL